MPRFRGEGFESFLRIGSSQVWRNVFCCHTLFGKQGSSVVSAVECRNCCRGNSAKLNLKNLSNTEASFTRNHEANEVFH